MGDMNRRDALGLVTAASATAIFGGPVGSAAAGDKPGLADHFVVGPFRVGDWFRENPAKLFSLPGAPEVADVVKALDQSRVYLIDRRDGDVFADGFPLVAFEGQLRHQWKKAKADWEIHVIGVERHGLDTNNSVTPPTRDVNSVTVNVWAREREDHQLIREGETVFSHKDIRYDLTGKMRKTM